MKINLPEMIAALKEENEFVFGEIFNDYHQKIYFYILAKTKSPYLAEEITQLTFIKLWDNRSKLKEDVSLIAQLFQIAKTTTIDVLRKEKNKKMLFLGDVEGQHSNNITEAIDTRELYFEINQAVTRMPPVRKMIFELSRNEAKSHKEIARILSLSEKTVERHIYLALKQLRRVFSFL